MNTKISLTLDTTAVSPKRACLVFLGVFLCSLVTAFSASSAPTKGAEEIAEIHGVATLDLSQISQPSQSEWVIMQLVPAVPGSLVILQQGDVDHKNKKVTAVGDKSKPMVLGKYKIILALTKTPKSFTGVYRWEAQSTDSSARMPNAASSEELFVNGATVICRVNEGSQGSQRFQDIHAIPEQWKDFAKPAMEFHTINSTLFDAKQVAQNETRLRALLDEPNPFIAVAACKLLNQARLLDAEFASGALMRVRGLRQAIFTLFLTGTREQLTLDKTQSGPYYVNAQLAPEAAKLAQTATVSGLKNLALGVYAAGVSTTYDPFEKEEPTPLPGFGPTLLRGIAQRIKEIKLDKPGSEDERNLLTILRHINLLPPS